MTLTGMLGREDPIFYLGCVSDPSLFTPSPVETLAKVPVSLTVDVHCMHTAGHHTPGKYS